MEEIVRAEVRGLRQDEGVGSGMEVIGIGDRRGKKLMKDMGMIGGDGPDELSLRHLHCRPGHFRSLFLTSRYAKVEAEPA